MKRISAIMLAAAIVSVACTKETCVPQRLSVSQITATYVESQTKTILGEDETCVLWTPNDAISVFYNGDGLKFTSINQTPKATTMFVSDGTVMIGSAEDYGNTPYLYGIYPYSTNNAQEGENLTLTVPADQTAVDGSFGRRAFPSVGRSKDTNIAFYNVCGGIRFSVTTSGVKRVVFSGMNNEDLAGKVKAIFDQNGKPAITTIIEGDKELNLYNMNGFTPGKYYYMSAVPTVLANGFKMVFYTETKHATLISSSSKEIKRSTFGTLKDADIGLIYEDGGFVLDNAVDLGLSVKWATCNVGAAKPEEYGTYFAWGDVAGQTWNGWFWSEDGFSLYPKYELDTNGNLKLEYDAANVNLSGSWRMPTEAECRELIYNCSTTITNDYNGTGVAGLILTSNKEGYTDKSIFLPSAGYGVDGRLEYSGSSRGYYWSSTLCKSSYGKALLYRSNDAFISDSNLCYNGFAVRPVSE